MTSMGGSRHGDAPARAALAVCVVVTAGFVLTPSLEFGFVNEDLDLMVSVVDGCAAFVVLGLLIARKRRGGKRQDQVLTDAVALLAVAPFVFALIGLVEGTTGRYDVMWTQVLLRTYVALLFLVAAASSGHSSDPRRDRRAAVVRRLGLVVVAGPALLHQLGANLPAPVPDRAPDPSSLTLTTHPVVIVLQVLGAAAILLAAALFARQARRHDDVFVVWLAAAFVFFGFSRVHYALYPSLYPDWLYSGEVLRMVAYFLLLTGAVLEIRAHYFDQTRAAVEEERRRLARELHDGIAQELTLIRISAQPLTKLVDDPAPAEILAAADRAEAEVRAAIDALTLDIRTPLGHDVVRVARDAAVPRGLGIRIQRLDDGVVEPAARHEVLRIVREAVTNAGRHGRADEVEVSLARDGQQWRLVLTDDGCGFAPEAVEGGYGLTSMRDRARALSGRLTISSGAGRGTTVEVCW